MCVQLPVFKLARLKFGALYTNPRYSARNEKCLVNAYSAPAPYTNVALVSKVARLRCDDVPANLGSKFSDRRRVERRHILTARCEHSPRPGKRLHRASAKGRCRQRRLLHELSSSSERHIQLPQFMAASVTGDTQCQGTVIVVAVPNGPGDWKSTTQSEPFPAPPFTKEIHGSTSSTASLGSRSSAWGGRVAPASRSARIVPTKSPVSRCQPFPDP